MNRADKIIQFIETLRLPDGTNVGKPFILREWQKTIIREVYNPTDNNGKRLVRQAVLSMGRKNGKSVMISAICLCHLCSRIAIKNGQLYSLSIDREQAGILFNYAKNMVYMDEQLSEQLNVIESRKQIVDPKSGSVYSVLSGEKKGKMGKSSSFVAFDELAEFGGDRSLYDALLTSTAAHEEPMIWTFSTQSADDHAILSELIDYGEKINRGDIEDSTFKCFLYTVPDDYDVFNSDNWYLANPALGDFRNEKELKDFAEKATQMPSMEQSLRKLYMNQRVSANEHFLSPSAWKACGDGPRQEALQYGEIYAGLDLSQKNDLTALIIDAVYEGEHNIFSYFWTPGDNIRERQEQDRVPYVTWRDQGYLIAKPGKTIDYKYVAFQIAEIHGKYHIKRLKFDRWKIDDLIAELDALGVNCGKAKYVENKETKVKYLEEPEGVDLVLVPHGQGYQDMNSAVEAVEDGVIEKRVQHGNHPVLTWCASNAVIQKDPAGSRKFAKDKVVGRIDGIVAMSMAMNGAELPEKKHQKSVYEERGMITI